MKALFQNRLLIGRVHLEGHRWACHVPSWRSETAGVVGGLRLYRNHGSFTQENGTPWIIAFLIIMGESFGSLGLLAGFLTRFTAASLAVIMLGAIMMVHVPHGFFMNWFGQQQGEGYE